MAYNKKVRVVVMFEFVDEILKCDHLSESDRAVLSCGAAYYSVQGEIQSVDEIPKCDLIQIRASKVAVYYAANSVILTFESVEETLENKAGEAYFLSLRSFFRHTKFWKCFQTS